MQEQADPHNSKRLCGNNFRCWLRKYKIQYPISTYTFPSEARIHQVRFSNEYIHMELTDGRMLSVPLWWIPTLYNASPEEREKYTINPSRTMIIWDPDKCAINDELRVADYLGPRNDIKNIRRR